MAFSVLSLSDRVVESLYNPNIQERFGHVDWVLACGDLPYSYVEYIVNHLPAPVFFVHGNHDCAEWSEYGRVLNGPSGAVDLHRQVVRQQGLLMAGIEGSIRYKNGPFMYSQSEMWLQVINLAPHLLYNRLRYGRYLDVFVTHAPPWQIQDGEDMPHQGIRAFRWLLQVFKPAYHFHGHVHVYGPNQKTDTQFGSTRVINAYGYRLMCLEFPGLKKNK